MGAPPKRPVQCLETKEVFASVTAACKALGVTNTAIKMACVRGWPVKDLHFRYLDGISGSDVFVDPVTCDD
eukprot:g55013.t1